MKSDYSTPPLRASNDSSSLRRKSCRTLLGLTPTDPSTSCPPTRSPLLLCSSHKDLPSAPPTCQTRSHLRTSAPAISSATDPSLNIPMWLMPSPPLDHHSNVTTLESLLWPCHHALSPSPAVSLYSTYQHLTHIFIVSLFTVCLSRLRGRSMRPGTACFVHCCILNAWNTARTE